jgi:mono/diheme cytochrome c family protein
MAFGAFGVSSCRQDMHDNPRYEAYEDGADRQLPEGTVARGALDLNPSAPKIESGQAAKPQSVVATAAGAGAQPATASTPTPQTAPAGEDGFPFKVTREILDRGQSRYEISCAPCHGKLGDANGMIVLRGFRRPPNYTEERLLKAPSSYFYDVITNGFGAMSSYGDQLTPEDRWKVIAYIRVLQLSQRADVNQLADVDKKALEEAEKKAKQGTHSASGGTTNK